MVPVRASGGRRYAWMMVLVPVLVLPAAAQHNNMTEDRPQLVLEPEELQKVTEGTQHRVRWQTLLPSVAKVTAGVENEMVAEVTSVGMVVPGAPGDNFTYYGYVNVSALFIGYNNINVTLYDDLGDVVGEGVLRMSVLLSYQNLSDLFTMIIGVLVTFMYVSMGATIDLQVIWNIIRKPIGPMLGMICQYIFMPLIAFGIGLVAFPDNVLARLGLFLLGCCPGGGSSNMWTYMLDSSLDLSIMMTFASSVAAFAMLPAWVLLLGRVIMADQDFYMPYKDIALVILGLSFPCFLGILAQRYLPRVTKALKFLLTPVTVFNLLLLFTFGVYANRYVFSLFDVKTVVAGFGLPALGYMSGYFLALIFRLPHKDRVAISIETGIQNATLAVFILKFTLEKPAGDLTVLYPAASVVMTPVPLVIALTTYRLYLCYRARSSKKELQGSTVKEMEEDRKKQVDLANGAVNCENGIREGEAEGRRGEVVGGRTEGSVTLPDGGLDNPAVDLREEAL